MVRNYYEYSRDCEMRLGSYIDISSILKRVANAKGTVVKDSVLKK